MEIHGAGGPPGPQPIYPRLATFSVEAGTAAPTQGEPGRRARWGFTMFLSVS